MFYKYPQGMFRSTWENTSSADSVTNIPNYKVVWWSPNLADKSMRNKGKKIQTMSKKTDKLQA